VEVKVGGEDLVAVDGLLGKERIYFHSNSIGELSALVGIDVEAKPATVKLVLKATTAGGEQRRREIPLKINAKAFHKESFNVPPSFDQMSPENLAEIRREQAAFAGAFANTAAERFWSLPFLRPVPQEASASSFGSRRIINGVPRAPHSGTDLSAPAGTEVVATNHGKVALVGNYFFAGGSVIIDHGGGLYSMYFHLSEFKVEEGAMVRRGDVVALSGGTGRVTGPASALGRALEQYPGGSVNFIAQILLANRYWRDQQNFEERGEMTWQKRTRRQRILKALWWNWKKSSSSLNPAICRSTILWRLSKRASAR
jgi:hypothetical protein